MPASSITIRSVSSPSPRSSINPGTPAITTTAQPGGQLNADKRGPHTDRNEAEGQLSIDMLARGAEDEPFHAWSVRRLRGLSAESLEGSE